MPPTGTGTAAVMSPTDRLLERAYQEARSRSMVAGETYHAIMEPVAHAGSPWGSGPGDLGPITTIVLPPTMSLSTGPINFPGGTPVRGEASIKLYQSGNYEFYGHFHDSGAPSYDAGIAWLIVGDDGHGISFERKVHLNGTFESGSRDGNWMETGNNPDIAAHWGNISAYPGQYHARYQAVVNWDWGIAVKQVQDAMKAAGTVISSVTAIVALF